MIDKIIQNNGKYDIKIIQPNDNIETRYTLKNISKTFYYKKVLKENKKYKIK